MPSCPRAPRPRGPPMMANALDLNIQALALHALQHRPELDQLLAPRIHLGGCAHRVELRDHHQQVVEERLP